MKTFCNNCGRFTEGTKNGTSNNVPQRKCGDCKKSTAATDKKAGRPKSLGNCLCGEVGRATLGGIAYCRLHYARKYKESKKNNNLTILGV